jgi:hypothetical protein
MGVCMLMALPVEVEGFSEPSNPMLNLKRNLVTVRQDEIRRSERLISHDGRAEHRKVASTFATSFC